MKMLRSTPSLVVEEGSDSKSMRSLEVLFTIRVETKEVFSPPLVPQKQIRQNCLGLFSQRNQGWLGGDLSWVRGLFRPQRRDGFKSRKNHVDRVKSQRSHPEDQVRGSGRL